jgi:hypothetical protein
MAREMGISQTIVSRIWRAFGLQPLQAVQRSAVRREGARHPGGECITVQIAKRSKLHTFKVMLKRWIV